MASIGWKLKGKMTDRQEMTEIPERRALYNLLHMNWLRNPELKVEPWQVEDYRSLDTEEILARLDRLGIGLQLEDLLAYANDSESPEELTETLLGNEQVSVQQFDQLYLLIFELWRKHVPDKPCISVFCDELDYQINLYDRDELHSLEDLEMAISNFQTVLNENSDQGADPQDIFTSVCAYCANDIENFLYDFITEQIDDDNNTFATELLDAFYEYVQDVTWFELLRLRLLVQHDKTDANVMLTQLVDQATEEQDLEFDIELLGFMIEEGDRHLFMRLLQATVPLLEVEGDLQEVLKICSEFYERLDFDAQNQAVHELLQQRIYKNIEEPLNPHDPCLQELVRIS